MERVDAADLDCLGFIFVLWVPLVKWGFLGDKKLDLSGSRMGSEWLKVGRVGTSGSI